MQQTVESVNLSFFPYIFCITEVYQEKKTTFRDRGKLNIVPVIMREKEREKGRGAEKE